MSSLCSNHLSSSEIELCTTLAHQSSPWYQVSAFCHALNVNAPFMLEPVCDQTADKDFLHEDPEASIVYIAGAGFRLSLLLNAAACQLAQSRIEIHSIAKGVSLFCLSLKHVGQFLGATRLHISCEAIAKAREIASQGQIVLSEIEHMLDKLQGTDTDKDLESVPIQERLKWCFRKQHVTYLLAHLEFLKLSLIVILRILQLGELVTLSSDNVDNNSAMNNDEIVAQEKAETQNMIIVRYWSLRRLDRLWDLVEQEAHETANDPTYQRINSSYSSSLGAATKDSNPDKLHVVTFGTIDWDLAGIERSPKDMVHLSEDAMNHLLLVWVTASGSSQPKPATLTPIDGKRSKARRVSISSDIEDAHQDNDSPRARGHYIEGNTVDWRKPQSQEARKHAAELRQRYSNYQAHVESDSESDELDEISHRPEPPLSNLSMTSSSDDREQSIKPGSSHNVNLDGSRRHASSVSSRYPPSHPPDGSAAAYPSSFPPPSQTIPHHPRPPYSQPGLSHIPGPPQQWYKCHQTPDYNKTPHIAPQPKATGAMPISLPRSSAPNQINPGWAQSQGSGSKLQPHYRQPVHHRSPPSPELPSRSAQRHHTHSHRRSSRGEAKERERHKSLTRNATRGLVGIGAIAGFMDALEAFSLI